MPTSLSWNEIYISLGIVDIQSGGLPCVSALAYISEGYLLALSVKSHLTFAQRAARAGRGT